MSYNSFRVPSQCIICSPALGRLVDEGTMSSVGQSIVIASHMVTETCGPFTCNDMIWRLRMLGSDPSLQQGRCEDWGCARCGRSHGQQHDQRVRRESRDLAVTYAVER